MLNLWNVTLVLIYYLPGIYLACAMVDKCKASAQLWRGRGGGGLERVVRIKNHFSQSWKSRARISLNQDGEAVPARTCWYRCTWAAEAITTSRTSRTSLIFTWSASRKNEHSVQPVFSDKSMFAIHPWNCVLKLYGFFLFRISGVSY